MKQREQSGENPPKMINLMNQRFGRLTVIGRAENDHRGRAQWRCACVCGRIVTRQSETLRRGRSRSCGCLKGGGAQDMSEQAAQARARARERYWRRKREREMVRSLASMKW